MKVLIIEDDKRISDSIAECLTSKGLEVKVGSDSMVGIQIAHQFKPDFILLDLMMPFGGGTAVIESIRDSKTLKATPIIVMTGSQDEALKKQLLKYGIKTYLQKPFELQDLMTAVADFLSFHPKPGP